MYPWLLVWGGLQIQNFLLRTSDLRTSKLPPPPPNLLLGLNFPEKMHAIKTIGPRGSLEFPLDLPMIWYWPYYQVVRLHVTSISVQLCTVPRIVMDSRGRILRRRGRQPSRRGRQPTILPKISKKLHEIEKSLDRRSAPLDPPLRSTYNY